MLLPEEILELLWPVFARENQVGHAGIFWTQPAAVNRRIDHALVTYDRQMHAAALALGTFEVLPASP
jgi:hypothetical protein